MIPEAIEIETSAMMFFFSFICALDTILKDYKYPKLRG